MKWFKRSHRHNVADDTFWINGKKQYGQVCECGATRYMTAGGLVGRKMGYKNCNIWTDWKMDTEWSKFRPLLEPKPEQPGILIRRSNHG